MYHHTYRQTERVAIPLCTTWSCVSLIYYISLNKGVYRIFYWAKTKRPRAGVGFLGGAVTPPHKLGAYELPRRDSWSPTFPDVFHFFSTQDGLSVTIILLTMDYNAAIGGQDNRAPLRMLLSLKHTSTQPVDLLTWCASKSLLSCVAHMALGDPSFNGVSVIMCKVIHTDRRSVPLYLSALRGRV